MRLVIKDVDEGMIDDLISLCAPEKEDPLLVKGIKTKKKWAQNVLKMYGSFAKIAYVDSTPAGMIQYIPDIDERIIEIQCIFVPDSQHHKKRIGSNLLKAVIKDMETPKSYFNDENPLALVAHAFEVPGWFPQHTFYQKMGFNQVGNDPYLLYYPFQKGYIHEKKEFIPQKEDEGKVLIFYNPSCPFCIQFVEKATASIREVVDIPIRPINTLEDKKEVKKRGRVPVCVVNKIPIKSFFADKEKFQSEIKKALARRNY